MEQKLSRYSLFWRWLLLGRWKTLQGKFLHAFLNITVAAILILVAAMITFFWLQNYALLLAEKNAPMFQTAAGLEIGLQRSLASIRGWISVADKTFLEQHQNAWNNQVWPNYQKLYDLSKKFDDQYNLALFKKTKAKLVKLYNIQWSVGDVAHTLGNNQAFKDIYLKVHPVYVDLIGLILGTSAIQAQSKSFIRFEQIRKLNQLQDNIALSLHTLQNFALTGRRVDGLAFEDYLKQCLMIFSSYKTIQNASDLNSWFRLEKESLEHFLALEFRAFQKLTNQVQKQADTGVLNIAEKILQEQAIPLEKEVSAILADMVLHQQNMMKLAREQVSWISLLAPWVMLILIISLLTIAVSLAIFGAMQLVQPISTLSEATKLLAEHQLGEDIPITSEDEMGQLTVSFNKMRASLQASEEQTERLLLNMLPKSIVRRLREGEEFIVDPLEDVSVIFIDIVKFTSLVSNISPKLLVDILSQLFSEFDKLVVKHHLEKIKTIGDAYMVVGGAPEPDPRHLENAIEFALDALKTVKPFNEKYNQDIQLRIGMHRGPVVAGVIGQKKFSYDLWGDTVNIASRMESHGIQGTIQVSEAVYQKLKDRYSFEIRGKIEIKGKKDTQMAYLLRPTSND
ncbi:adenylate/guanylate cyclase domain-containing protein [Legionella maioricensis]|uniref:Adenylate cyclase n=1 Tax=Legionella maioricensis TaxID=2896528 RepID=A0A9X2CY86_9GAMM|nr:adenylate/guanylate cyclase domain-containing protein [Legionella maioricensis]MCL9682961.1 HAMP domain-containing protein [Legionella maioricensis]MCL9686309.1 HAMP domain-containing protein [Legionella maioricensis]